MLLQAVQHFSTADSAGKRSINSEPVYLTAPVIAQTKICFSDDVCVSFMLLFFFSYIESVCLNAEIVSENVLFH